MAIVQLDKILSGVSGNLEHVILYSDESKKTEHPDYTNGVFAVAEELHEGERELKKAVLADGTKHTDILLLHAPELMYDEKKKLREFMNVKGGATRGYRLAQGDVFTFTVDLLPEDVKVGDKLGVTAGKLAKIEDEAVETNNLVLAVIEDSGNELDIKTKAFALEVKKSL